MGDDDDPDAPDALEDWEGAQEHGQAMEEYILEREGYAHGTDPKRNADGTFRRMKGRRRKED